MNTFKEKQKFDQWWLWVFFIALGIFPLAGIYKQIINGEPFGSKPLSDTGLIVVTVLIFAFIALFYILTLKTEIDAKEIRVGFFPFFRKRFQWVEIDKAEVVNYGFVGGWGLRIRTSYGTVFNVKGNTGLAIQLKSGKKFLVGTQKEEELKKFMEQLNY